MVIVTARVKTIKPLTPLLLQNMVIVTAQDRTIKTLLTFYRVDLSLLMKGWVQIWVMATAHVKAMKTFRMGESLVKAWAIPTLQITVIVTAHVKTLLADKSLMVTVTAHVMTVKSLLAVPGVIKNLWGKAWAPSPQQTHVMTVESLLTVPSVIKNLWGEAWAPSPQQTMVMTTAHVKAIAVKTLLAQQIMVTVTAQTKILWAVVKIVKRLMVKTGTFCGSVRGFEDLSGRLGRTAAKKRLSSISSAA